ncbi:MAG: MG2 domain-containing protein, partial [Planctomycetota bacterium]
MRRRILVATLALAVLSVGVVLAKDAIEEAGDLASIHDAMADRDYPGAARRIAGFLDEYEASDSREEVNVLLVRAKLGIGDFEGALEVGRRFLGEFQNSPWDRKVRFLMADAFSGMKGFKDAARIYRQQMDFLSGDGHLSIVAGHFLTLAKAAYDGVEQPDEFGRPKLVKDFRRALDFYQKARNIHLDGSDAPEVSWRIGMSRFELGDRAGAVSEWTSLLAKWPEGKTAGDATYWTGYAQFLMGRQVDARRHLRKLRETWGDSEWAPHALVVLGWTYKPLETKSEDDLARGLAYWKKYRELHPSHEKAEIIGFQIGQAEFSFGHFDAAIAELTTYLGAFADAEHSPHAQDLIALAYFRMGEFDKSIAAWKKFLGQWPNHELWTKVQARIAEAAFMKGADPLAEAAKAPEKDRPGLWDRAETGFKSFLAGYAVHPRAAEAQYLLAQIEHHRKDFAKAISEWRITASKFANTKWAPAALYRVAATYEKDLGDLEKAIEQYEELVRRYAASGEARTARKLLAQFRKKLLEVTTERVFRTNETVSLKVRSRNIESLKIRAWPVNLEDRFREKMSLGNLDQVVVQVRKAALDGTVTTPEFEKYRLFEREVALSGKDLALKGPGAWIVTLQDKDLTATTLVVVSDLAIVTKESPGQTLVFAVNERTGTPWSGVKVLLGAGGKVVKEGATGREGTWLRSGRNHGSLKYFAGVDGHIAFTDLAVAGRAGFGYSTKAFIYTDRPLYRPGHDVKFRGIYREVSGGNYRTSAGEKLTVEVRDPRDTVLFTKEMKTSAYGTVAGEVFLPETAALGTYRVLVTNRHRQTYTGTFEVREFKKPEFTIAAKADRRNYLPGEEVKLDVSLRYFFGGPVPKTTVRYRVARGPYSFDPSVHEEFAWFAMDPAREREKERREAAGVTWLSSGELTTDENGNAELTVKTEDLDEDLRYLVFFEALDLNRQWVRESASAIVTRAALFVLAKSEKKVYRPGEEATVELTTVDAVHFPMAVEGEMIVARRRFVGNRETETIVSRQAAKTGEDGRGLVKVKVDRAGEYRLKFVATDRGGNEAVGGAMITIAGEAEDLTKQAKVVASRQMYREGDTAEVLVNSPVAPVWALLTFEGERVLDHRVVKLEERSTTLSLPMKPEYSPNVFVKIAIPGKEKLHEAQDEIYVFKYLEVAVTPDRAVVKPGEKVSFTVATTDQRGQPVEAETSLALFDRSILALQPDMTAQIKPFFYDQRRVLVVKTGSSLSFRYAGHIHPTNKDLLWEELRRLGPEKFNQTMKIVGRGKDLLARGDLEGAAIELRKALRVSPMNYEAGELLSKVEAQLEVRRLAEFAKKAESKSKGEPVEDSIGIGGGAGGKFGGRGGKRNLRASGGGTRAPGSPAPQPAEKMDKAWAAKDRKAMDREESEEGIVAYEGDDDAPGFAVQGRPAARKRNMDARNGRKDQLASHLGLLAEARADRAMPTVPAQLRKRFADTAHWAPHVVTGKDGKATVEIELPDNLTTWRAIARGATKLTLVGEGRADVVAKKDMLVRIDTPRFLTQKDRVTVTATVHNNLAEDVEAKLALTGENIGFGETTEYRRKIGARRIRPFDFELDATSYGLAQLKAEVLTSIESDAAAAGLPVLPHGERTFVGRSGEVVDEAYESFTMPDGIIPGTRDMVITLSPGIDGSILESLVYLGGFPYGCLEQTVNRFLPAIAARNALRETGSMNEKLKKALDETVERGLLALYAFQNGDGSFGWFSGRRIASGRKPLANPTMTALAILAIERAREAGYRISGNHRERALASGARLVKSTGNHREKALLLFALSKAGRASLEDLNQVYRYRDGLGSFSLATLALAMEETKRKGASATLVELLKVKAARDGDLVHWLEEGGEGGKLVKTNDVETTAYALRALLLVEPDSPMVDGAAKWLLVNKRGSRWVSTRDTGAAVVALSEYLVGRKVTGGDYVLEVWLNDGEAPYQKLHVAGGEVAGDQRRTVIVDGARLKTGENKVRLVKRGSGQLFYSMHVSYYTEAESIAAEGNLVKVGRRYLEYVSPVAQKAGRQEIRPGWTIVRPEARPKERPGDTIDIAGSGDKFRIRLEVEAREALPYVILTDPLPAGVEVVEGQATGPFDWHERRDEKQVFFLTNLPEGKTIVTYLVQAIHPGEFHAMPAEAYPMYEPAIHGRSAEQLLSITREPGRAGKPATAEGITPDEIWQLAVRDFKAEEYEKARAGLERLVGDFRLLDKVEEEC